MNSSAPAIPCFLFGVSTVSENGTCNCFYSWTGPDCGTPIIRIDPLFFAAYIAMLHVLIPLGHSLMILYGLAVLINKWRREKQRSIATFAVYALLLGGFGTYTNI